ncbi:NAD(P)-binding protein [Melanomma pulvis-pyrius CBS 109.77]|uniref:NAD(P)-binding protein n=1 Tax=Melanomma pulvis-pyrius CBS 109.77 TaxID=1314802 RepID=A0A6A6WWM2_9PLEO|nr:NAD(P)-binding protein [Melanomma pulvis-pyrius CBS 109.77]
MADQEEKVIILTGASRGIGLAAAHTLLSSSHKLVVISRTHAALDQLHYQYPSQVEVLAGDLSNASLRLNEKAVELALSRWGRLDALIVNHGTLEPVRRIAEVDLGEWERGFRSNVGSAVGLIQAAIPSLRKSHGRIIITSSGASQTGYVGWGCYGATKAVLNHLALTLTAEEPLIATISIRPGVVDTEMQREIREVHAEAMSESDREKFAGLKRDGGLLRAEQPGGVIARLAVRGEVGGLKGKFLSWNDASLGEWQEE